MRGQVQVAMARSLLPECLFGSLSPSQECALAGRESCSKVVPRHHDFVAGANQCGEFWKRRRLRWRTLPIFAARRVSPP